MYDSISEKMVYLSDDNEWPVDEQPTTADKQRTGFNLSTSTRRNEIEVSIMNRSPLTNPSPTCFGIQKSKFC